MVAGNAKLGSSDGIGVAMVSRCGITAVVEKIGREARLAGGGIVPIVPNGQMNIDLVI